MHYVLLSRTVIIVDIIVQIGNAIVKGSMHEYLFTLKGGNSSNFVLPSFCKKIDADCWTENPAQIHTISQRACDVKMTSYQR